VAKLKKSYKESSDKTKEEFKKLSDELFKHPKEITNYFIFKISKYDNIEHLMKELNDFLKEQKK
jgi:hypothetical protein